MNLLTQLLTDPLSYILLALLWVGKKFIQKRIEAGVDSRFATQLETHKQELSMLTEASKFDFQRQLADFNLFAVKKHDATAKVWETVRIAHGAIAALFGLSFSMSLEEYNESDLRNYFDSWRMPKGKQEEIIANWRENPKRAIADARPYLRMLRVQDAERKFNDAKNTMYLNELYFTDALIADFNSFISECATWIGRAEYPGTGGDSWVPDHDRLNRVLEKLHTSLRASVNPNATLLVSDNSNKTQ